MWSTLSHDYSLKLLDHVAFECEDHETLMADLTDLEACRQSMEGVDALLVAHMASRQAGSYKEPPVCFEGNVTGTANILFAAAEQGIQRAVLISSCDVVKSHDVDYWTHDLPPKPGRDLYCLTKVCQENIAEYFHRVYDMKIVTLRIGAVLDQDSMIDKYGRQREHDERLLTDPRDIAQAALLALALPNLTYEVFYVVGSPNAKDRCDIAHTSDRLGWTPQFTFAPSS